MADSVHHHPRLAHKGEGTRGQRLAQQAGPNPGTIPNKHKISTNKVSPTDAESARMWTVSIIGKIRSDWQIATLPGIARIIFLRRRLSDAHYLPGGPSPCPHRAGLPRSRRSHRYSASVDEGSSSRVE